MRFLDQMPKGISLPAVDEFENGGVIGYSGGPMDQMKNDRRGYGWYIEKDKSSGRRVNSVYWAGAANTYFTLDPENKIAIVYFPNSFPLTIKKAMIFINFMKRMFIAN